MEKHKALSLIVGGLTLDEIEELLRLVRKIEMRHPSMPIVCSISGLEGKSIAEAKEILREIFPVRGVAS